MPTLRRTARVGTTQLEENKAVANKYMHDIAVLKAALKEKRLEYELAVMQRASQEELVTMRRVSEYELAVTRHASPQDLLARQRASQQELLAMQRVTENVLQKKMYEYDVLWMSDWPQFEPPLFNKRAPTHFEPRNPMLPASYPPKPVFNRENLPYPNKTIINKYIGPFKRREIVKAALLVNRGVKNKRRRGQEFETAINGMMNITTFEHELKRLLNPNPPGYTNQNEEEGEDWENAEEFTTMDNENNNALQRYRQLADPTGLPAPVYVPSYANAPPSGEPPALAQILPRYSSPDYLQISATAGGRGRKTRRKKQRRTRRMHQKKTRKFLR
jgi:hypothetical protein